MEYIFNKQSCQMDKAELALRLKNYRAVRVDIGTGDGQYVQQMAKANSDDFVIGIDACRENLYEVSRKTLPNTLYVIANAENLPLELMGVADFVTINFPWGSLLQGLLDNNPDLMASLHRLAKKGAPLEVRLNSSALLKEGWSLEQGAARIQQVLTVNGFGMKPLQKLDAKALRSFPSSWAKKLGYGRDPHAFRVVSGQ